MAKRKNTTRTSGKSGSKFLFYLAWALAIIALMLGTLLVGYYLGKEDAKAELQKKERAEKKKRETLIEKLQESTQRVQEQKSINERLQDVLKKESEVEKKTEAEPLKESLKKEEEPKEKTQVKEATLQVKRADISASHEIDDDVPEKFPEQKRQRVRSANKPRLTIIIDDVGTKSQVNAIKSLNLPLVMSFLPPSKGRPHTPALAAKESRYMVHLPMEAVKFSAEEPYTLHVNDSQERISKRISEVKKLFPKADYMNNHTGSKFTADEKSMNRLIYAMNANGIKFIDSRTTGKTKVPKVLKNYGLRYLGRDIFLDHHMDKPYILSQIKKAVKVAKVHGTAIAIGHPHKNTLQALRESKKVLQGVDLVFIDKL